MSAMGVEDEALESARERSSAGRDLDPGLEAEAEMMGSRGRGLSEMTEEGNSNDGRSLSNDGRRGESSSRSTRGGARPTEDTVVAVVSALPLRAELALMPNNRVMLGFEANRGDRRGFSIVSETGVIERVEAGISTGGIVVSPKSIILAICPAADGGGGVLNSSSRRSISSENTLPGMLSEGPSESIRARIVIRFVSWCDAISERRLTVVSRFTAGHTYICQKKPMCRREYSKQILDILVPFLPQNRFKSRLQDLGQERLWHYISTAFLLTYILAGMISVSPRQHADRGHPGDNPPCPDLLPRQTLSAVLLHGYSDR